MRNSRSDVKRRTAEKRIIGAIHAMKREGNYVIHLKVGQSFGEPVRPEKADMFSRMSSRQGCGSSGVKVLTSSITCIRRLAYSVRAEATKHVQPERKSLGCPVR